MSDSVKKRPWWLRVLRAVAVMLLMLALLLGTGAWWLLGTSSGAKWLVSTALPYAQDNMPESLKLDVQDIDADTLASIRIGRITLADAQGVWFEIDELALLWHPSALMQLTFDAEELSAKRIHFIRPPAGEEEPQKPLREQLEAAQITLRQLPDTLQGISLPPMRIKKLAVNELAIDSGLTDIPSRFRFAGHADLTQAPAQMELSLDSLEGVETHAGATLKGITENAQLNVHWTEAQGGILGNTLQLQAPAPVKLQIAAHINGQMLHHEVLAKVGDATLLDGTIDLPMEGDTALQVTLTLQNPQLLTPLAQQQKPITLNAALAKDTLTVKLHTDAFALGDGKALAPADINAQLAFDNDEEFALSAAADTTFSQGEAEPMPLSVKLAAKGDADAWEITSLTAAAPDMQANAQGTLDLSKGNSNLTGNAVLPQLDAQFTAKASNLWENPTGQLELVLQKLKQPLPAPLDEVVKLPLTLTAQTEQAAGDLPDIALKITSANINGTGLVHSNAQAEQTLAEAEIKVDGLPVPLTLTAEHKANGSGHASAKSKSLIAQTDYRIEESLVALDKLRVDAKEAIKLAGDLTLHTDSGLAEGTIKGYVKSTAPLKELGIEAPLVEASKGEISIKLAAVKGVQVADANYDSGAVRMDGDSIGNSVKLTSHIELPPQKSPKMDGKLTVEAFTWPVVINTLTLVVDSDTENWNWKLDGDMPTAKVTSSGTVKFAEAIVLTIAKLGATWGTDNQVANDKPIILAYGAKEIALQDLALTINTNAHITADASLKNDTVDGTFAIDKLPMNVLPVPALASVRGLVSSDVKLSGQASNPKIEMLTTVDGLQQNYPQMANLHNQPLMVKLRAGLQNREFTAQLSANAPDAESFAAANLSLPVDVSLQPSDIHFTPKGNVDAALKADLILAPFLPLLLPDGVYGAGHMVADISVKGAPDNPDLNGTIDLHSGHVEVLQAGTIIDDLSVAVVAQGNKITIKDGKATDGNKGTLNFGGSIELTPTLPMDVQASLKKFVAARHPSATATLTGDATLKGDLTDALLKGDWAIDSAKITIIKSNAADVTELDVVEVGSLDEPLETPEEVAELSDDEKTAALEKRRKQRPFTRNLKLDLSISAANQIFLDGFGLDAELKGKINIAGTADKPKLGGKMETVRGRWEFFGRTFTITRGEAVLSEENLTAPLINIRAEADADDVTAIAQISGTTDNPKIEFSSIPALPKDEVLSRVMFGENLNSISPFQALQLADMLRSLSGSSDGGSINPLSKLQDTLGIDQLKINSESGNTEDTTVGVGKYLREDVYLEVEGGSGEKSGKVSVEVDLTPNISVETEARQNAESAVRLNYKYDY